MSSQGIAQIVLFFLVLLACVKPLGGYMARVYEGKATTAQKVLGPTERIIYKVLRIDPATEMTWKTYAVGALLFNVAGILLVYVLQRLQGSLPANPQAMTAVAPDLSFNTAVSFVTNTNWQAYGGESSLSYLVQMTALTV